MPFSRAARTTGAANRHARAEDNGLNALVQNGHRILSQTEFHPGHFQFLQPAFKLFPGLGVVYYGRCAPKNQQLCRGDPAAGHAHYQRFFEFHLFHTPFDCERGNAQLPRSVNIIFLFHKSQQRHQAQKRRHNIIHSRDPGLGHTAEFKMMMQRRHAENALAVSDAGNIQTESNPTGWKPSSPER